MDCKKEFQKMCREETIRKITLEKIVVITRGIYGTELMKLSRALYEGGIRCFEITYDPADPDTMPKIRGDVEALRAEYADDLLLGVGTVLTAVQVQNAADAGANFIVSPNFNPAVVAQTRKQNLVSIPGAMTPTEICGADEAGADFIKLFPAGTLGIQYCKDIYAPLHHVKYIATVGVTEETFRQYLDLGFAGAGISSQLVDRRLREAGNWAELTKRAERFVAIARAYQ